MGSGVTFLTFFNIAIFGLLCNLNEICASANTRTKNRVTHQISPGDAVTAAISARCIRLKDYWRIIPACGRRRS
jgi:hypothetical protein